jgi:hypothetical protein
MWEYKLFAHVSYTKRVDIQILCMPCFEFYLEISTEKVVLYQTSFHN